MKKGLTLVEIIVVMAIVAAVALSTISFLSGYQRESEPSTMAERVIGMLRYAQSRSVAGEGTTTWGVHFDTSVVNQHFFSIFQGASYAAGSDKDPIYLSEGIRISNLSLNGGGTDVLFNRLTGLTSQYGTGASSRALCIALISDPTGCKQGIIITSNGKISLQ